MKRFLALFALIAILLPATVQAQTPTYGNFEFKLGGWYPSIDDEFGGSGPFEQHFGDGNLLIGEIEFGAYFWQGFGKLGASLSVGYTTVTGNALATDGTSVSDETTFSVWPFRANVLYRLDIWAEDNGFPLVPAAKLGLDLHHWNTRDTQGNVSSTNDRQGSGWKWGWHGSLGVHFLLDIIDPESAALFDLNWGINNTYLFAEFYLQQVNDFGADGLDLSDNFFMFGLNFEY